MLRIMQTHAVFETRDAGIVDQHIQPTVIEQDLHHHALPIQFDAHIEVTVRGIRTDRLRRRLPFRIADIAEHDVCALFGKTRAIASPIPRAAPVTNATLPSRRRMRFPC